jgi:hypothetical protein
MVMFNGEVTPVSVILLSWPTTFLLTTPTATSWLDFACSAALSFLRATRTTSARRALLDITVMGRTLMVVKERDLAEILME